MKIQDSYGGLPENGKVNRRILNVVLEVCTKHTSSEFAREFWDVSTRSTQGE